MNSLCEVCEVKKAMIYCVNCSKLHLYCKECYETSHQSDAKKSHKIQEISAATSEEERLEEMLFCQEHENKYKEYACLICNQSICPDCQIIGKHIGHKVDTIQKGYEKIIKDFETYLSEYEEMLKVLDINKTPIVNYLNNTLEEIKLIKQKIIEDAQNLIKTIEEKTKEIVIIVDSKIESFSQSVKLLQKSAEEFKETIEKCSESIKKMEMASHESYHKFSKSIRELECIKELFNKWLPIASLENNKYAFPLLEPIRKYMMDMKGIKVILANELKQLFDERSIVSTFNQKMLLLTWISEACKTRRLSLKLLWKGTMDGFSASTFHNKCDNQGATVTIILSDLDYIFGGFTTKSWVGNGPVYDPEAFIFSLTHKTKLSKQRSTFCSIYCRADYGPIFGGGNEINICDNCNIYNNSHSKGNHTYDLPEGVGDKTYLAGAYKFRVRDIEVYSVITY